MIVFVGPHWWAERERRRRGLPAYRGWVVVARDADTLRVRELDLRREDVVWAPQDLLRACFRDFAALRLVIDEVEALVRLGEEAGS